MDAARRTSNSWNFQTSYSSFLLKLYSSLVKKGADIHVKDNGDETPLYWTSREGHTEVVNLLIETGADIHLKDNYGGTPLHSASSYGRTEVINLLIEKGADIKVKDKY